MNYHKEIMQEVESLLACNAGLEIESIVEYGSARIYMVGKWIQICFICNRIVILGIGSRNHPNGFISDLSYGEEWFRQCTKETTYLYGKFVRFQNKNQIEDAAWVIAIQRLFVAALDRYSASIGQGGAA